MAVVGGDIVYNISGNLKPLLAAFSTADREATELQAGMLAKTKAMGIGFTALGGVIVGGFGLAVKKAADFETALTNAASVTGKTGDEFTVARDKMEELAKTLGRTTVFSASEAANAFYDLSSKGFDVAAMSVKELEPLLDLAAATQSDLATTTEIVTGTLRGFGLENKDTTRIADVFTAAVGGSAASMEKLSTSMPIISKTADVLNVSLEETTAALGILYNNSIDASTASTGLRNVMLDLSNIAGPIEEKFKAFDVSIEGVDIKTQGLSGAFEVLKKNGLTAEKALAIFGKRSGTIAATILDSTEKLDIFTGALGDVEGKAHTVAQIQLQTLSGQLKLLASAFEAVVLPIGKMLIPILTELATSIAGTLQSISEWVEKHEDLTKVIVIVVASLGAMMLVFGPLLIMLPGIAAAFGLIGAGGTAAAGVFALMSIAAIPLLLAIGAIIIAVGTLGYYYGSLKQAQDAAAESEKKAYEAQDGYINKLREKGVVLENEKMKEMDFNERAAYISEQSAARRIAATQAATQADIDAGLTREQALIAEDARRFLNFSAEEAREAARRGWSAQQVQDLIGKSKAEVDQHKISMGLKKSDAKQDMAIKVQASNFDDEYFRSKMAKFEDERSRSMEIAALKERLLEEGLQAGTGVANRLMALQADQRVAERAHAREQKQMTIDKMSDDEYAAYNKWGLDQETFDLAKKLSEEERGAWDDDLVYHSNVLKKKGTSILTHEKWVARNKAAAYRKGEEEIASISESAWWTEWARLAKQKEQKKGSLDEETKTTVEHFGETLQVTKDGLTAQSDEYGKYFEGLEKQAEEFKERMMELSGTTPMPPPGAAAGGVIGKAAGGLIPAFAQGGRIVKVGERGEELVGLPVGSRVMSHSAMTAAVAGGSNSNSVSVVIQNPSIRSQNDILQMVDQVKSVLTEQLESKLSGHGVLAIQGA